ncbi:FtsX-like permease family protein [Psychrobium sp. 1_MG-2023]|uniref:ABC transporter permease n=1 Tax=Psychrobium sp. 1_MG-2023 TaxID=3062624 RepID=UPI000C3425FB|nr:FtsX-like permease family protein [Psychrobium sp. 1_MG-2023]MDP2562590.1 ABC transporter permease [Psychrobium sp. 1_MG-2023]PKF59645.1 permease [Alteromonadales bacterium alter-6D02]
MSILIDIQYALRLLFKAPKFTLLTLGVLVGGLSISLFTFSFLYSSIYKDLPLPEGESVLAVTVFNNGDQRPLMSNEYLAIQSELSDFSEFGVYDDTDFRYSIEQSGKNIEGSYVRAGFFEFSRTQPIMGRVVQASDTETGASAVAVISYQMWQNELAADPEVVGRQIIINNQATTVIGVMPEAYYFPNFSKIWLPLLDDKLIDNVKFAMSLKAYARLKEGVSIEQAQAALGNRLNQIYQHTIKASSRDDVTVTSKLLTFQMAQTGGEGTMAFIFLNTVVWLILLLACINVGNLLLARAIERQKETAIRAALGAKTSRLVSQLMWEGVIISTLGGLLSVLLVGAALDYTELVLQGWIPSGGSFWWHYGMDTETLLMAVVFTVMTIFLSSFLPAWRSAKQDINMTLRDGTRGAQSKQAGKLSRILVTTQVFLVALLMLIGSISGFIAHKFINIDMGDDFTDVMVARWQIPEHKYEQSQQQVALMQSLSDRISQHSQVADVMSNNWLSTEKVAIEGVEYETGTDLPSVDVLSLVGNPETIGVKLVAGRVFSNVDSEGNQHTAIISQSMAKRFWPAQSPLDKFIKLTVNEQEQRLRIVGVVSNRMNPSTLFGRLDSGDEVYVSGYQFPTIYQTLHYRLASNTAHGEEIFYQAMFKTDQNIKLTYSVAPAKYNRNKMRESMQLMSNITFGTGFFALMLALVGIYGLTANTVAQRTHEVGIRRAVGATDRQIIEMFLRQGAKQLIIGIGSALAVFVMLAYGFHSLTEGLFPMTFYFVLAGGVTLGLAFVVMIAILIPTKRAVIMEPSIALRYE